jgi:hypothetical protein
LREAPPDFARIAGIAVQFGIGQLTLEFGVFSHQHVNRLHALRHAHLLPNCDPEIAANSSERKTTPGLCV